MQATTLGNILAYLPVPLEAEGSIEELVRRGREASLELGIDEPEIADEDATAVWCVVANIAKEQHYGRAASGQDREGTKHFAAGAKVYCLPAQWGDGYDRIVVIGHHRESKRYVKMVLPAMRLTNWRAALVYSPYVIAQIGDEWDGTVASRLHAEQIAQWCLWREAKPNQPV